MSATPPRVVIIGGGFGGLACARRLAGAPLRVTLVDRRNHHLFQPLLYQVATAALNPGDIAVPLRAVLRDQANATVLLAEVERIDVAARTVHLADGSLEYDALVVAAGATHSWFGHDDWAPFAPGLKTLADALSMRERILRAFESAERETDLARRGAGLTFVIVGGGPTGVELAGAIAEIGRESLARDFRSVDPKQARVVLIEAAPRVLATFPADLSERARRQLERIGVEVRVGTLVVAVDAEGVTLAANPPGAPPVRLAARTAIWAAGVAASPLAKSLGAPLDRAGRVRVEPTLAIPGRSDVFVVGDLAAIESDGKPVPGVAPAAMQMGRHAATNVLRSLRGEPLLPFRYRDRGSLATIGRAAAVAELGRLHIGGPIAWLLWTMIHIWQLIGFRNRLLVMVQWAWLWLTRGRGVRLITNERAERR